MPRETKAAKRERAIAVEDRMNVHYPEAECALVYEGDPFRLDVYKRQSSWSALSLRVRFPSDRQV